MGEEVAVVGRRWAGGAGEEARELGGAGVGLTSLIPSVESRGPSSLGFPWTHLVIA